MAPSELKVHEVQYLSCSTGKIDGEPIVVITIRPDEGSFRPHNLGLVRSQANRLLEDLQRLLAVTPLLLLLMTGCSGRVDVTTETRTPSETTETVEKLHTSVGIDVLGDRDEAAESRPEEPSVLPEGKVKFVEIDGDENVVVIIESDGQEHPRPKAAAEKPKSSWNTKIPWPTQLRGAPRWTVGCYLAVWGLVIVAIVLMIGNLQQEEGGPLLSVIAMLGTVVVLLQFLPHTDSGVQFVPLSPWAYAGWESFFVSLVCWMAILGAGYVTIVRSPDSPQAFAALCLIALSLNVLLSWSTLKETSASRPQAAAYQHVGASFSPAASYRRGRPLC